MRKEDVKVGMKVLVKASTFGPVGPTRAMVGHVVEVRENPSDGYRVVLWNADKTDWWNFDASDIEPAETPQVPSVTINGTVYVPEYTIKAPEPAPAPKFFWGQFVTVKNDPRLAVVVTPEVDDDGEIKVVFKGPSSVGCYVSSAACTPIGA